MGVFCAQFVLFGSMCLAIQSLQFFRVIFAFCATSLAQNAKITRKKLQALLYLLTDSHLNACVLLSRDICRPVISTVFIGTASCASHATMHTVNTNSPFDELL